MTVDHLDTIILAGGKGTRLQELVNDRPKPMAPVAGRPFVEWVLLLLRHQGIKRAVMSIGHLGQAVISHFGNGRNIGMQIVYALDPFPLGTGGAVRNALDKTKSNPLLISNADSYCRIDLRAFLKTHLCNKARVSLSLVHVNDCSRFGSVEIAENGTVLAFHEKSAKKFPGLINAGVYLIERDVIYNIPESKTVSLERQIFPTLIGNGLYATLCEGTFIDIGTPESYLVAEEVLRHDLNHLSR